MLFNTLIYNRGLVGLSRPRGQMTSQWLRGSTDINKLNLRHFKDQGPPWVKSHLDFEVAPDSLILKYFFVSLAVCLCTPSSHAAYLCYLIGPWWMTYVHFQHVKRCVLINVLQVTVSNNEKSRLLVDWPTAVQSSPLFIKTVNDFCFVSLAVCSLAVRFLPSIFLFT